jgi:hypothetical protein
VCGRAFVRVRERVLTGSWFFVDFVHQDQPVKPSFLLDLRAMGIINVKDFVFLQGYYEPTLLILYEPTQVRLFSFKK